MEIHVLYDNRPQPDKLPLVLKELEVQALWPQKIWEPVQANTVVESISRSFKQIILYAKEKKLPEVCIVEDDLMFVGPWDYFLKSKPVYFDIYIGGNYLINDPDKYEPPLVKVNEYVGNQLIVVSEKYYDTFLSVPDNAHIDVAQSGLGDFYVCFPMVALQRPGYSANAQAKVNYNTILKPEWIYNGAVHHVSGH